MKKIGVSIVVSIILIASVLGQAMAGPSYTTTMSFFEGFDLEEGVVDQGIKKLLEAGTDSPDLIRLVFVADDIKPEQTAYEFAPSIDFQVGYNAEYDFLGILPNQLTSIAVLENQSFSSVLSPNIFTLGLTYDPIKVRLDRNDTILVWTGDDNFFKLGNFSLSGANLIFDYEKIEPDVTPIPEPSMFVFFGIGLLGIAAAFRKKTILRKKKALFLLVMVLVLNGTSNAYALKKSQTGFVYPVDADYIPLQNGGYVGWLDKNNYHTPPYHLGVDFKVAKGLPVYAIADGEIIAIDQGYGGTPSPDGAIMIRHQTSDESYFTATYGHITMLKTSGTVKVGEHIGNIADCWVDGKNLPHLHFSIHPGTTTVWTGYTSDPQNTFGFVNPLNFLENNFPRNLLRWEDKAIDGVNLDLYCQQRGYDKAHSSNLSNPWSWTCQKTTCNWSSYDRSSSGMSVNYACQEQHPGYSYVWAEAEDWGNAYTWKCYTYRWSWFRVKWAKKEIGGVEMRRFCQKERWSGRDIQGATISIPTRYADVTWRANDAGSWRCQGKSTYTCANRRVEIDVTQACREQRNPSAEAKVTDANSAYSWDCFIKVPVYSGSFKISSISDAETRFNVKVTKSGTGSGTVEAKDIACGPDCTGGEYALGSFVDLKAIPAADSTFAGWQVNGQSARGAVPVSSNPVVMTAKFDKKPELNPVITGVSPNPMPTAPDWRRQWLTIYGRNFKPGSKLLFKIVGTSYVYPDRVPTYISSTELRYYISVGPRVYDWTVEVIGPDGQVSNAYGFQVR